MIKNKFVVDGEEGVQQVTIRVVLTAEDNPFHTLFIDISQFEEPLLEGRYWHQSIATNFQLPRNTHPDVTHVVADLDDDGAVDVAVGSPANGVATAGSPLSQDL